MIRDPYHMINVTEMTKKKIKRTRVTKREKGVNPYGA